MTVLDCFAAQLADAVAFTAISEIPWLWWLGQCALHRKRDKSF